MAKENDYTVISILTSVKKELEDFRKTVEPEAGRQKASWSKTLAELLDLVKK